MNARHLPSHHLPSSEGPSSSVFPKGPVSTPAGGQNFRYLVVGCCPPRDPALQTLLKHPDDSIAASCQPPLLLEPFSPSEAGLGWRGARHPHCRGPLAATEAVTRSVWLNGRAGDSHQ